MIGIDGQWILKFSISGYEDFIDEPSLQHFSIIEEAGNILPLFQLVFYTYNDDILSALNEGNIFQFSVGSSFTDLVDSELYITQLQSTKSGSARRLITVSGIFSAMKYVTDTFVTISSKRSAFEVVSDIVSQYENFQLTEDSINLERSKDSQCWIQPNISDKKFVTHLWTHADVGNDSFPMCGIASDGTFILKDVKTDLAEKVPSRAWDWVFTPDPQGDNEYSYDGDFVHQMNSGVINNWMGYGREKLNYNFEEGLEEVMMPQVVPLMSLSSSLSRRKDIERRFASMGFRNENIHSTYWNSYIRNVTNLAVFSTNKITLSFTDQFFPVKILDLIMFKDGEVGSSSEQSSEYHSGLYYVSKVSRTVQNRRFSTLVEIVRESPNALSGELD